jgi:hypothetical protein
MGYSEWVLWNKYFKKYGPLNPIRKYDRAGAMIAHIIDHALGGKHKFEDFLPFGKHKDEEDEELRIGEYIEKALGGKVKIGKRKRR